MMKNDQNTALISPINTPTHIGATGATYALVGRSQAQASFSSSYFPQGLQVRS